MKSTFFSKADVKNSSAKHPFTLSHHLEDQKEVLHGYEARALRYIPKVQNDFFVISAREGILYFKPFRSFTWYASDCCFFAEPIRPQRSTFGWTKVDRLLLAPSSVFSMTPNNWLIKSADTNVNFKKINISIVETVTFCLTYIRKKDGILWTIWDSKTDQTHHKCQSGKRIVVRSSAVIIPRQNDFESWFSNLDWKADIFLCVITK